jgi:hypothetical protein
MDFLLDNRPLRLLTSRVKPYDACSYDNLIEYLNEVGFFESDSDLLFPTFLTLEFIGVTLEAISRPKINVDDFPKVITDRVRAIFEYSQDFFSESSGISKSVLMDKWKEQSVYQRRGRHARGIYQNLEKRIHSPHFHEEVCLALALDVVSVIDMGAFELPDTERHMSRKKLSYDERMVHSNRALLRWILGIREGLLVPVTAVRIANRICTHTMRSNLSIEIGGETQKLLNAFEFGAKSDGADMEYTDYALLGYSGRSVMSITFDCYDKAALRVGAVRWLYKNAIDSLLGADSNSAHAKLINGEVLHFSNEGIKRIQAGNLEAVDLKIIGL